MCPFYHKDGLTYRTNKASELCSQQKFYMYDKYNENCYSYYPMPFDDAELQKFVAINDDCTPQLCAKTSGDFLDNPRLIVLIIRADKIVEEKTFEYVRGYHDAWMFLRDDD